MKHKLILKHQFLYNKGEYNMTITYQIYHNPRCSKSRQALFLLKESGVAFEVIDYLKSGLDKQTLTKLIVQSKLDPLCFLRTKEKEFASYKNKNHLSLESVVNILSRCPKLLERPVVVKGNKVVIARPPDLVKNLL